ncbi:MAG TPA: flagellar basal body P-ring formation chaperone FlgA [Nitrospiraceae bacterium]|nr:flagellar basal body P-ring formation chaperone FlgA [Nitrospiraceae bacterium]
MMRLRDHFRRIALLMGAFLLTGPTFGTVSASAGSGQTAATKATSDHANKANIGKASQGARQSVQPITVDQLRKAIVAHLEARFGSRVGEVEAEILDPSEPVLRPAGPLKLEVTNAGGADTAGRRRFRIVPMVAGQETESLDVIADVSLYADVVAPTRMLKPEELIEPDDVGIVRVKVNGVPHHFLVNPEEAVGKSPGKVLQPQMPIRGSSLVKPFTVRKGDRVTIEARRGGLSIQATGITKAAAQLGQYVTVTNQDSGKDVRGRVAGPGLVRVEF